MPSDPRVDGGPPLAIRWDGPGPMVPKGGLEPPRVAPHAPQTCASASPATAAPPDPGRPSGRGVEAPRPGGAAKGGSARARVRAEGGAVARGAGPGMAPAG